MVHPTLPEAELSPEARRRLDQRLIAVPMPKSLLQYLFSPRSQQAYRDTLWDLGGDPNKQHTRAADPKTAEDGFINRVHAYYTDEGLLFVRRRNLKVPSNARASDFMVTYTRLTDGSTQKLPVSNYEKGYTDYGHEYPQHTFVFDDDPRAKDISIEEAIEEGSPHLVVNPRAMRPPFGRLSLGDDYQKLLGDAFELPERARRAENYFTDVELGHIAKICEVAVEPVTMAA